MEEVRGERVILVSDNGSQPTSTKFLPSYEELVERTKVFEKFYNEEYPYSVLGYNGLHEFQIGEHYNLNK